MVCLYYIICLIQLCTLCYILHFYSIIFVYSQCVLHYGFLYIIIVIIIIIIVIIII